MSPAGTSVLVSLMTILHVSAAFVVNIYIAGIFGLGNTLDAYYSSITINAVVLAILTTGLHYSLIPSLVDHYSNKLWDDFWRLGNSVLTTVVVCTVLIGGVQLLFSGLIIDLFFPGFDLATKHLATRLLRYSSMIAIVIGINAVLVAINHAQNNILRTIVGLILSLIAQFVVVWLLHDRLGALSLVVGLVAGELANLALLASGKINKLRLRLSLDDDFLNLCRKLSPVIFIAALSRSEVIIDRFFSSTLLAGSISVLFYGRMVCDAIGAIVNKGVSVVSLRQLSLVSGNQEQSARQLEFLLKLVSFVVIPTGLAVVIFGYDALVVAFSLTNVEPNQVKDIYIVVLCLLGPIMFGGLGSIVANGYYAMGLTGFVARLNILTFSSCLVIKLILFYLLGLFGLALSFTLRFAMNFCLLLYFYTDKVSSISPINFYKGAFKVLLLSLVPSLLVLFWRALLPNPLIYLTVGPVAMVVIYGMLLKNFDLEGFKQLEKRLIIKP